MRKVKDPEPDPGSVPLTNGSESGGGGPKTCGSCSVSDPQHWFTGKYFPDIPRLQVLLTVLKVPSCQIGSAWERYHWKGLKKDINRYMFLIFFSLTLNIWEGLFIILSSYWLSHFYLWKKSATVLLYFGLDCGLLVFFKYSTHKP